jgi:hypothetical protein
VVLDGKRVEQIHLQGGTILGTSRGGSEINRIVDRRAPLNAHGCV